MEWILLDISQKLSEREQGYCQAISHELHKEMWSKVIGHELNKRER